MLLVAGENINDGIGRWVRQNKDRIEGYFEIAGARASCVVATRESFLQRSPPQPAPTIARKEFQVLTKGMLALLLAFGVKKKKREDRDRVRIAFEGFLRRLAGEDGPGFFSRVQAYLIDDGLLDRCNFREAGDPVCVCVHVAAFLGGLLEGALGRKAWSARWKRSSRRRRRAARCRRG